MVASSTHALLEELERRPRDGHRYDLVAGRLIEMPPAWPESSRVAVQISFHLEQYRRHHGVDCVVFGADAGFRLTEPLAAGEPPVIVSPDVSVVARSKLPADRPPGFWPVVPDLAVEVVSPSDRWRDVEDKIAAYRQAGVPQLWVLDPQTRTATVYRQGEPPQTLRSPEDRLDSGVVLPGLQLTLDDVFTRV